MKYKIKGSKRAFTLVLVVALAVAAGSVLYWRQITSWLERDAQVSLEADAKENATNISHLLSIQLQVLTAVAVSLEEEELEDNARLISYLNEQNRRNSFQRMGFQFPDGKTLFSSGHTQRNFLSKSDVDATYEHSHFISAPRPDPFGTEPIVTLAVPVRKDHKGYGIVFATHPVSFYAQALAVSSLGSNGLSLLLDREGNVLISYPQVAVKNIFEIARGSVYDAGKSAEQIKQHLAQGESGTTGYVYNHAHRFASYVPLGYNGWYVMSVLPTQSVAEKAQRLVLLSLVLCLSVIGVLSFLLIFILRLQYQSAKELYKMGFIDPLLKSDNLNAFRLKFADAAQALREKKTPPALLVANINQFKAINDMYGFERGDEILLQVARSLQNELQEDELFCRSGSDVFLLLLACPDPETLGKRVEKMLENAGHGCNIEHKQVHLRLTGGIYILEEEIPFYIMLDRANLAAASAKQRAGSLYGFYESESLRRLVTEKRIESDMEHALQNAEFKLYLQPKCDFKTGRIVSAEALVRWQHATQGMIRPDWFIPVFEKNGFVVPLDWYMFRQVVQALKKWIDGKLPVVPVGVNFSRLHLDEPDFIGKIVRIADEIGVPPRLLEIELTESVVCGNLERMKGVIDELHAAGFSVAMDDFGAGYSSLNVLKNLDFDCVKLDKEFLAKGEGNPRQLQVISGLVRMIKELGCHVVAEGVETQEQAKFLASIGCDMAQGFLYSRPLPASEFEMKLQDEAKK